MLVGEPIMIRICGRTIRQIKSKNKTLKELILKSIEVFEYEQLLQVPL